MCVVLYLTTRGREWEGKKKHLKAFSNPNPDRPPEYQSGTASICGGREGRREGGALFPSDIRMEMNGSRLLALFFPLWEGVGKGPPVWSLSCLYI